MKLFCISMQRSGTSSVGDFLEIFGLSRIGHQRSSRLNWSRKWLDGNYKSIIDDPEFINNDVFEDDPFWFPDFFKFINENVSGARFIFMERDSDSWFKSMISHSNGFTLGQTDIHAKVYERQEDLEWLKNNIEGFDIKKPQGMVLYDKPCHYKAQYENYADEVKKYFSALPREKFFYSHLNDKGKWERLREWLYLDGDEAFPRDSVDEVDVHVHKTKAALKQEDLLTKRNK